MSKLTSRIAVPIILVGVFAIVVFIAIGYEQLEPDFYILVSCLAKENAGSSNKSVTSGFPSS